MRLLLFVCVFISVWNSAVPLRGGKNGDGSQVSGCIYLDIKGSISKLDLEEIEFRQLQDHPSEFKLEIEDDTLAELAQESKNFVLLNSKMVLDTIDSGEPSNPLNGTMQLVHTRNSLSNHLSVESPYISMRYTARRTFSLKEEVYVVTNIQGILEIFNAEGSKSPKFTSLRELCELKPCVTILPLTIMDQFNIHIFDSLNFVAHYFQKDESPVQIKSFVWYNMELTSWDLVEKRSNTLLNICLTSFIAGRKIAKRIPALPYGEKFVSKTRITSNCDFDALLNISKKAHINPRFQFDLETDLIKGCNEVRFMILGGLGGDIKNIHLAKNLESLDTVIIKTFQSIEKFQHEFAAHTRIYDLLNEQKQKDPNSIVRVPRPDPCPLLVDSSPAYAMEALGPELYDVDVCNFCVENPADCVAFIGIGLLDLVDMFQKVDVIYRDWKPENIVFGTGRNRHHLYAIDVESAKVLSLTDGKKIIMEDYLHTLQFCAMETHKTGIVTWSNEYESAMIILLFLLSGNLPWGYSPDINLTPDELYQQKENLDEVCAGVPGEQILIKLFKYLRYGVPTLEKPDVAVLKGFLNEIIIELSATRLATKPGTFAGVPLYLWNFAPTYVVDRTKDDEKEMISLEVENYEGSFSFITQAAFCRISSDPNDLYYADVIAIDDQTNHFVMILPGREELLQKLVRQTYWIVILEDESPLSYASWDFLKMGVHGVMRNEIFRNEISKLETIPTDQPLHGHLFFHGPSEKCENFPGTPVEASTGNGKQFTDSLIKEIRSEIQF